MIIDARTLPPNHLIEADICIVGAGAAGITLARSLSGARCRVALLESGGLQYDSETQSLYEGLVVGVPYTPLARDRLRFLGGTTNHWQGSCRPFNSMDLEGWPFGLEVLEPYYRQAQKILQLGPYTYHPADWSLDAVRPIDIGPAAQMRSGIMQYSPPTRFGSVYRGDLESGPNLTLYLHANVTEIQTTDNAELVTGLSVACLNGGRFQARAKHYVLATGGLENTRLLLVTDRVQKTGLGNQNDLVGRFYMDHPYVVGGATVVADGARPELLFYDRRTARGTTVQGYFEPTDEVRRREKLPPFAISLFKLDLGGGTELRDVELPDFIRSHLSEAAAHQASFYLSRALGLLEEPAKWLHGRMWRDPPGSYTTYFVSGPDPDAQSRVSLIDQRDALGMRRIQLDWRLPANFEQQMQRAHELLGQDLGRAGLARVRIESSATGADPMNSLGHGHHEMGSTRMHSDPRQGVVDADCRLHGVANLFIAGSSVFPTYACDDPTMTIVALALKLADHLKTLPPSGQS